METLAPTKYDPTIAVRVPARVREALKAMARNQGATVTDVVLDQLKPWTLYASDEGQQAYERIRQAVAESTTVHKGIPPGYKIDHEHHTWEGLPITWFGELEDSSSWVFYHTVRQREGQSRQDAIRTYADAIWKEWVCYPGAAEADKGDFTREQLLEEVTDPARHYFVIAYVNFSKWLRFPSTYELGLHRSWFVEGRGKGQGTNTVAEVESQQEASFVDIHAKKIAAWWKESTKDGNRVQLHNPDPLPVWNYDAMLFKHYPHITDEENISTWTGQLLKLWRSKGHPEPYEFMQSIGLAVDILTIDETV